MLRHLAAQLADDALLLGHRPLDLTLGPEGGSVVGVQALHDPIRLGGQLPLDLANALLHPLHPRVLGQERLTELPVLALAVDQVLFQLGDERVLEHRGKRLHPLTLGLLHQALLRDPLGARLEESVRQDPELLGHEVLAIPRLVRRAEEEDVVRLHEAVEGHLRGLELGPRLLHLLGQELGGVASGLDLLVEILGDEGLRQRIGDARGQVRIVAFEGDLDEPRIADGLDGQPPLEGPGHRRLEREILSAPLRLGRRRHRHPLHEVLPGPGPSRRDPATGLLGPLELRVLVEFEKSDHPIRQGATLQDLELGLVVVLLGVGLHDLLELEDSRLVLLDPEGRRGREDRAGRECPDRGDDHAHEEEGEDCPAVACEDGPVVPEMGLLGLERVRPELGGVRSGERIVSGGAAEPRVAVTRRKRRRFAHNPLEMLNMPRTNSRVPNRKALDSDCPTMTTSFFCSSMAAGPLPFSNSSMLKFRISGSPPGLVR